MQNSNIRPVLMGLFQELTFLPVHPNGNVRDAIEYVKISLGRLIERIDRGEFDAE